MRRDGAPDGGRPAARFALVALGLSIFALHASVYGDWLVDDAGISLAYAMNLAAGHGLVSQPGVPPVEGYSNPSWVFLLAAMSRAGVLVLPLAPKLVSGVFVGATYGTLLAIVDRVAARPRLVGAFVVVACSLNPAFVIWATSGLENALYALAVTSLAYFTLRALEAPRPERWVVACGAVAALAAMTRPDGALFVFVPPLAAFAVGRRQPEWLKPYALSFGGIFGAFVVARVGTFHHLLPNTAVVKGGPRLADAIDFVLATHGGVDKIEAVLEGAIPDPLANVVFVGAILAARWVARHDRLAAGFHVLLAFTVATLVDYMLMPGDWMRESRFATAFFPLYYACLFALLDVAIDLAAIRSKPMALAAIASALLGAAFPAFAGRALVFARSPNIGLSFVRRAFAERFDRYAAALHVEKPSVLLPDVGGMLLWSHARVYDLAGLCDASIARTFAANPDEEREYIFGQVRATFIHAYGKFSRMALERDPRFQSDYVAIHTYDKEEDPEQLDGHATGIFVRRDALAWPDGETVLETLRQEAHKRSAFVSGASTSFLLRWLETTPLVPKEFHATSSELASPQK